MAEEQDPLLSEENLGLAKELVSQIESGNRETVLQLMCDISMARDQDLFQNVGKLARNLHDTVRNIGIETQSELFDASEFPDARERLNHVIQLTEESANTTLTIVECSIPVVEESGAAAAELFERWEKLCKKELSFDKFKDLSDDIKSYLTGAQERANTLHADLTKVLMAQGFQDLTGQLIKEVIKLVDEVENRLVTLVREGGAAYEASGETNGKKSKEDTLKGEGPALPSKVDGVVKSQDEVDDLLASLGF